MSPRVPRLRWDDPFGALDVLSSLWSSTGLPSVNSVSAQAIAAPYRTLFTTLQQLFIGKRGHGPHGRQRCHADRHRAGLRLESRGLAVGQLGEVRVAARDIELGNASSA